MFRNRNQNDGMNMNYYEMNEWNRLYYELDEINRKLRNLNNRLKRVESFLGLGLEEENNIDKNTGHYR